ncbi:hypothetical protein [Dyadobacter sp. LHD-138]|uniref:hypothetical protein n=1 Tax=Dyadobacter sp. LHD-138 TaxID=3071413 RepID=UPI0027E1BDC4|nr:hypothetical protein [Dyadobacter sp. LHD-138]MDQ6482623.1 hypothetical protein [Dyadobacter sp. LHD-138]
MFSKLIKLTFAITAYAPIILIWWVVSVYSILDSGGYIKFIDFSNFKFIDLLNRLHLIFIFIILVFICWYILFLARNKLTRNSIEVKSIKSSDLNMNVLIFSYFLPCIEIYKKDNVYLIGWFLALCIIVYINKGTYFHNPLMKLFGYSYYEIVTKREVTYLMISKQKLKNTNDIKVYSQLTDFVLLNSSN